MSAPGSILGPSRWSVSRLGIAPLKLQLEREHCLNGAPETKLRNCPLFSGIPVPELLKSLSANYRNRCPGFTETRNQFVMVDSIERRHDRLPITKTIQIRSSSFVNGMYSKGAAPPDGNYAEKNLANRAVPHMSQSQYCSRMTIMDAPALPQPAPALPHRRHCR